MFRALLCRSSGVCDYVVELAHIGCFVLGLLCVGVRVRFGWGGIRAAGSPDTGAPVHQTATYSCGDTRGCVMQF